MFPSAQMACSWTFSWGEVRSWTKMGTAPALTTYWVWAEVPLAMLVSAQEASNWSTGLASGLSADAWRNSTKRGTIPVWMTSSIGGLGSLERKKKNNVKDEIKYFWQCWSVPKRSATQVPNWPRGNQPTPGGTPYTRAQSRSGWPRQSGECALQKDGKNDVYDDLKCFWQCWSDLKRPQTGAPGWLQGCPPMPGTTPWARARSRSGWPRQSGDRALQKDGKKLCFI